MFAAYTHVYKYLLDVCIGLSGGVSSQPAGTSPVELKLEKKEKDENVHETNSPDGFKSDYESDRKDLKMTPRGGTRTRYLTMHVKRASCLMHCFLLRCLSY